MIPTRLPFMLPEWTRVQWVSAAAEAVWAPRVARITAAWLAIERQSVALGARASALQVVAPDQLPALVRWASRHGCVVLPLGQEGLAEGYASTPPPVTGSAWGYRVAITAAEPAVVAAWADAWEQSDHAAIGGLLGFPACCQQAFVATWHDGRLVDTTWTQATADPAAREVLIPAEAPTATNLLLRWLGVRQVPHLPCAHGCADSVAVAANLARVAQTLGLADEWAWAEEMLSWPTEWTALHGIALVATPVCTISTRTDATAERLTVRRGGARFPDEGATGVRFPYRNPSVIPLTSLRKFRQAFDEPARRPERRDGLANGFATPAAQAAAHDVVAGALGARRRRVLDLGCGDGTLARRLSSDWAGGVEIDPARAASARAQLDAVVTGDLFDAWPIPPDGAYDLIVLMPGRLLEHAPRSATMRPRLQGVPLLVYAYGDTLARHGSLEALVRTAGLPWQPVRMRIAAAAQAALLEV